MEQLSTRRQKIKGMMFFRSLPSIVNAKVITITTYMTVKCSLKLVQKRIKMTCVWGNQYEKVTVEKPRGTLLDYKEFTPSPLLDVQFSVIQNPGELKLSSGMEYMLSTYEVLCAILRTPQTNKSPVENLRAPIHDTWSEARFCVRKPSSG